MQDKKFNFKKTLQEIEEINQWLQENQDLDIDTALQKVEKGFKLIKEAQMYLKQARNKFETIKSQYSPKENEIPPTFPFEQD